jgi:hypothetical protein
MSGLGRGLDISRVFTKGRTEYGFRWNFDNKLSEAQFDSPSPTLPRFPEKESAR